ncbi:Lsr2 protein [Streptacidiphilus jiangxiensis]|uniref:Lsr2 protein n=2 Tax=Streptacidiphilus jiangxiensis TaxID=235985 RepID=A0A1H7REI3_STRJI|nr:Lsr2 protein [Streptacidiphilus jiangxiensis]
MGLLWRLLAPKSVKRARRSVGKVAHPVRTMTPKPIKGVRRAAYGTTHPWEVVERGVEDQVVRSARSRPPSPVVARNGASSAQVRAWAKRSGYSVADKGRLPAYVIEAYNRSH